MFSFFVFDLGSPLLDFIFVLIEQDPCIGNSNFSFTLFYGTRFSLRNDNNVRLLYTVHTVDVFSWSERNTRVITIGPVKLDRPAPGVAATVSKETLLLLL